MRRCVRCCAICWPSAIDVRCICIGARSHGTDLYEDEQVRALSAAHPNLHYTPVLSEAQPSDDWSGRRGLVHAAALEDHPRLQDFDVYASGPPAMVEAVRHEFIERGLPAQQLFFDSFDYAPDALAKLSR